jgi:hypothetical protein
MWRSRVSTSVARTSSGDVLREYGVQYLVVSLSSVPLEQRNAALEQDPSAPPRRD